MGLDLVEMAQRSGGRFTPGSLADIERGRMPIDDGTARVVTTLYELENGPVVPERSRLVVDLDSQELAIGSAALDIGSREVDDVLARYLSLLYILRSIEPGKELTLREPDLEVLSETLFTEIASVERRLGELMLSGKVDDRTKSLLRRFLIPSAGLLVAATTVGSLVIVSGGAGADTIATPVAPSESSTQVVQDDVVEDSASFEVTTTVTSTAFQAGEWTDGGRDGVDRGGREDTGGGGAARESAREKIEIVVQQSSDMQGASVSQLGIEAEAAESPQPVITDARESSTMSAQEQLDLLGSQAEDLIDYDWESVLPGWTVLYEGDSAGYKGLTHWPSKTITLYIDDGAGASDVAEVLAHELGHALDVTYMDNDSRTEWLNARGMPMVWWAGNGLNDFSVGAGDFAEAVASLWVDSPSDSAYGEFTDAQLQLVAELLPDA